MHRSGQSKFSYQCNEIYNQIKGKKWNKRTVQRDMIINNKQAVNILKQNQHIVCQQRQSNLTIPGNSQGSNLYKSIAGMTSSSISRPSIFLFKQYPINSPSVGWNRKPGGRDAPPMFSTHQALQVQKTSDFTEKEVERI